MQCQKFRLCRLLFCFSKFTAPNVLYIFIFNKNSSFYDFLKPGTYDIVFKNYALIFELRTVAEFAYFFEKLNNPIVEILLFAVTFELFVIQPFELSAANVIQDLIQVKSLTVDRKPLLAKIFIAFVVFVPKFVFINAILFEERCLHVIAD